MSISKVSGRVVCLYEVRSTCKWSLIFTLIVYRCVMLSCCPVQIFRKGCLCDGVCVCVFVSRTWEQLQSRVCVCVFLIFTHIVYRCVMLSCPYVQEGMCDCKRDGLPANHHWYSLTYCIGVWCCHVLIFRTGWVCCTCVCTCVCLCVCSSEFVSENVRTYSVSCLCVCLCV
jgi:hypothetical protein